MAPSEEVQTDLEKGVHPHLLNGFAKTADFMARDPDKTAVIYKRYDILCNRNLLYLQSRLAVLQERQRLYDELDVKEQQSYTPMKCASSWEDFETFGYHVGDAAPKDPKQGERWKLSKEIQEAIKEYQEALLRHGEILNLGSPANRTIMAFRGWFEGRDRKGPGGAAGIRQLRGVEGKIYEDEDELIALYHPLDEDLLTKFVTIFFGWLFITNQSYDTTLYMSRKWVNRCVTIFGTVSSIAFLVGAIFVLWAVGYGTTSDSPMKLGIIAAFVAGFALFAGLLTNARRVEICAAVAAYAAVLIVYVGKG